MRGESMPLPTSALYLSSIEGEVTELIERVGGVGDELAEKDLRVGVERMDDELEELAYFGLELLLGHGILIIAKRERGKEGSSWPCRNRGADTPHEEMSSHMA